MQITWIDLAVLFIANKEPGITLRELQVELAEFVSDVDPIYGRAWKGNWQTQEILARLISEKLLQRVGSSGYYNTPEGEKIAHHLPVDKRAWPLKGELFLGEIENALYIVKKV